MSDHREKDCDLAREALSARIDGERGPVSAARVETHLSACPRCRAWHDRALDQAGRLRQLAVVAGLRPPQTGDSPDHDGGEQFPVPGGPVGWTWARWALGLVGLLSVVVTVVQAVGVWEAGGRFEVRGTHLVGESVAWSAAIGVAMIVAALRPGAAAGLAGVLVAYSAMLAAYVVGDAVQGTVTLLQEVVHLPVAVGAVLALLVWRGAGSRYPSPGGDASRPINDDVHRHGTSNSARRAHWRPRGGAAA